MDIIVEKKYASLDNVSAVLKETSHGRLSKSVSSSLSNTAQLETSVYRKPDALQAIKLDPAVLKAQVTVKKQETTSPAASSTGSIGKDWSSVSSQTSLASDAFKRMVELQWEALRSISPEQLVLLIRYVATLRRQRQALQRTLECAFCKKNGESHQWFTSHALKDWRGRVLCPVLRAFHCPRCGATGDRAHTNKYCPDYATGRRSPLIRPLCRKNSA